ncbi:hypothetical protein [Epilithonimonas zeae]|uniref:hypothetical protein n=1 Tax=Epilithonimonas zeae TaxID=1416779 RepID=UPI00200EABE6|nr:hypothetical protein [Epilithonimonas zeae]UQB67507.1 hypothetical protein KI430_10695 [Epilithonimonas zeae]
MKKILITATIFLGFNQNYNACGWYDPDYDYFNLFAQDIIHNKTYEPFLLTYSSHFYGYNYDEKLDKNVPDENIESWVIYFDNKLTYDETKALITKVDIKHLNNLKKGQLTHQLFQKLGKGFYTKYQEAMDYLIQAKYMEPYMRINYVENPDSYSYRTSDPKDKNATQLNYAKTNAALISLYKAATNPEIKLRYAYQIVRFNHYSRKYKSAVDAFQTYVEPLKLKNHMYYYALDQKAGAERGLNQLDKANWDFFQVFKNTKNKKESAYNSMFLATDKDFNKILAQAKTPEDKNMAYFLLAYNSFNNPVPIMNKMIANNTESDILKVLTVRAINQLERNYLVVNPYCNDDQCEHFRNKRLPVYAPDNYSEESKDFAKDLEATIVSAKNKQGNDEFWQICEAYIKFLNTDYKGSQTILSQIKTTDKQYLAEIDKFKMLNEIVSQPTITPAFENLIMKKYATIFEEKVQTKNWETMPATKDFVLDILANRYFIEKQDAKSFLMNNSLSDLQYNPNSDLVRKVEAFYKKSNKTALENYLVKKMEDVADPESFFNVIYGDRAMRLADFQKAQEYYQKAKNFKGIPRLVYEWNKDGTSYVQKPMTFENGVYNGFNNISSLVFGYNVWESFQSKPEESMKAEGLSNFPFIKNKMNKVELADAVIQLENIGKGNDDKARLANQLLGNLLYNTSVLGYFRELFVMDVDNYNGPKFEFGNELQSPFYLYYKNFSRRSYVEADNFDIAINYYKKALNLSKDKENQARILFQMASAEQGKYYQWAANNPLKIEYNDPNYDEKYKQKELLFNKTKNDKYRTAFAQLKADYSQTATYKNLQSSCLYFGYYTKK